MKIKRKELHRLLGTTDILLFVNRATVEKLRIESIAGELRAKNIELQSEIKKLKAELRKYKRNGK